MTRIKIRDVGDYSIYVSEGTKASPLNLVFFLVVLVGCSFAVFAIFNRTVPIDFLFGTAFIVFGLLFLVASPFRSEVYWVSDSYNGPFNIDYIDKTGDEEGDNKEICRAAQRREKEIRAIIDREERLKKMAENCKELGAEL